MATRKTVSEVVEETIPPRKLTQLAEKLEMLKPITLFLFTILSLGAISAALFFVPRAIVIAITTAFFIGAFFSFLALFVLAPGASKLIFLNRFIYHKPLALLFDDTGNVNLIKGKVNKKGPRRGYLKLTNALQFAMNPINIYRFAGSNLMLCIKEWAGLLPIIAPVWAKAYEEQYGDEELNLVDSEGNPHPDLEKEVLVPKDAPVSVRSILKVMTDSYSPEANKALEINLKAAAKAGVGISPRDLVLYIAILVIVAGVFLSLVNTGGGSVTANIPGGGIFGG